MVPLSNDSSGVVSTHAAMPARHQGCTKWG